MDTEKNISITLKQPDETEKKKQVLSFSTLLSQAKRFFLLWLVVSIIVAMAVTGVTMALKTSVTDSRITALVSFNYDGIQSGLAPDGKKFDVNKIKSPSVIESALSELDMSLAYVEAVRRCITIKGVIPNDAMDQLTLYQSIYSSGGGAALSAVESLLDIGYYPSYYIIRLDYGGLGMSLIESKQVLDAVLKSYQDYFFTTYGYNESLGNSVVAVDYKEYDYPSAIDVFDSTLTNLDDYVTKLSAANPDFRSGKTGYSFEDLSSTIETIKGADLDSLSSYVIINNVTNDKKLLLTYYEYKIDQLKRNQSVLQSELDSLSNSIDTYEKDKMLILGDVSDNLDASYTQASEKYDELVENKVAKQNELSRCKQNIEYYSGRVEALNKNNSSSTDENKKKTEERLADINEKVTNLIDIVNKTADEYYETVSFAHAYNILVPATGIEPTVVTKDIMIPIIMLEAVLFIVYLVTVFVRAVVIDVRNNSEAENDSEELNSD